MKSLRSILFWSLLAVGFSLLLLSKFSTDPTPKVSLTQFITNYAKFLYKDYPRGAITGIVQFKNSAKHDNITISLLGSPYKTTTKIDGRYEFKNVPIGDYIVTTDYPGYTSFSIQITVPENKTCSVITLIINRQS